MTSKRQDRTKHRLSGIFPVGFLLSALLLTACVKDELHNTPHPDRGAVVVSISGLPQGETADGFTVEIGGQTLEEENGRFITPDPLPPGTYPMLAYNNPEGFDITDGIAYVKELVQTKSSGSRLIQPRPDCLWSGTQTIAVIEDDTLRLGLDVKRRIRDLHIRLAITEGNPSRIVSARGTLDGIAGAFDLMQETTTGSPTATATDFAHDGDTVSADLRLLGTMGGTQTFTLVLTFTDGYVQTVESDLTDVLSAFNVGDYAQPFSVTGNLSVPVQGSVDGCTISGWQVADAGNVDAH